MTGLVSDENKRGRPRKVSNERILLTIKAMNDGERVLKAGSQKIADELGYNLSSIHNRLDQLEARGLVKWEKSGQAKMWWLTDEGEEVLEE